MTRKHSMPFSAEVLDDGGELICKENLNPKYIGDWMVVDMDVAYPVQDGALS
jgi:hypothetical protein